MKPSDLVMRVHSVDGIVESETGVVGTDFERIHSQRNRLYRALALAVGDPTLAAEAVDEAMTRAYERWSVVSKYDNPEGWVYRVALNWARSVYRKTNRENLWSDPPDWPVSDHIADHDVRVAIGRLPVKLRSVVVVRYLLDWSTIQTAEALGIPQATVKTRLRRALVRLAKDLGDDE